MPLAVCLPSLLLRRQLSFNELVALYAIAFCYSLVQVHKLTATDCFCLLVQAAELQRAGGTVCHH